MSDYYLVPKFQLITIIIFISIDMDVVNMNLVDFHGGFYETQVVSNFDRRMQVNFNHHRDVYNTQMLFLFIFLL